MKTQVWSKLSGAVAGVAVIMLAPALASSTFPCAIQDGQRNCIACSECFYDGTTLKCKEGATVAAASCASGERARCTVTVGPDPENIVYYAGCEQAN